MPEFCCNTEQGEVARDAATIASALTPDAEEEFGQLLAALPEEQRAQAATRGLIGLLAEPLSYDFTRLLLNSDVTSQEAETIGRMFQLGGGPLPDSIKRSPAFFSVAHAREVYEPAVDKRVEALLKLTADANACEAGRPQRPLMCCAMNGWTRTSKRLLAAKALPGFPDSSGSTALHYAAIHHEVEMCSILLAARADPDQKDRYGRSAWDIVKSCYGSLPQTEPFPTSIPQVLRQSRRSQGIMELEGSSLTSQRFIEDFVALKRPVLVRRASKTIRSLCSTDCCRHGFSWRREDLIKHASEARVMASEIPYGSDFGLDPFVEQPLTLGEFMANKSSSKRQRTDPERTAGDLNTLQPQSKDRTYFFVAVDREAQPELSDIFERVLCLVVGGPLPFPCCDQAPGCPFQVTTLQFAVGEAGSGSPMHFHQDAVNLLLSGRKRWWLQPPSLAAMSRLHPLDACRGDAEAYHSYDTAYKIEQEIGDVMYVPDMWGHAVLNLEPHTVCAAAEFA